MEILDLRHFSSSDLRALLDEETQMWAQELSWDYQGSAEMILRYIDAKILPGYVAVERGLAFGYSFFVYEGTKGVIGDLFVAKDIFVRAAESGYPVKERLLAHVISTLQQSPGIHRVEAQLLAHVSGEVSRPFLAEGFQCHRRLFMGLVLNGQRSPMGNSFTISTDIEVRRWNEQDYQAVAFVITESYRGHIDSEINDQYRSISGSLRFLNNIVRFPGCGTFDPSSSFVALHKPTRKVIGAILCSRVKDDVGHVTQVCVVPEFRGKKIGEALLDATSADLQRRHFSLLTLTVTEANRGAVDLYKRLGYGVRRVFDAFVWEG